MPFEVVSTPLPGLMLLRPKVFSDERGAYIKHFEQQAFAALGIIQGFTESSDLHTHKGGLRGLHYQRDPSQAKICRVVAGAVFDVALDLRPDSTTFGQYHAQLMRADEPLVLCIPAGFAHGFMALEDNTIFSYHCAGAYVPELCGGIRWDDPELSIPWPLEAYDIASVIATPKDKGWPTLAQYCAQYGAPGDGGNA